MLSPAATPVVEVDAVSVALAGRPVLRGIDLTVGAGEFVALLGPNGSGKSTLVRTVTGLLPPVRGEVRLFGAPLAGFAQWARVGFVPQRVGAGSGVPATVREVVGSGRLSRRRWGRASAADRAAVAQALRTVGLADRATAPVSSLSGGQQQRVLIARALAGEPELLVMDEPTAGVDLPSQEALSHTLRALSEAGTTVVLVAHELGPLAPLLDRAVVLRDGRVVHDGPAADLLEGGHLVEDHHGHHGAYVRHDHAPHVASPLDPRPTRPYDRIGLHHDHADQHHHEGGHA